MAEIQIPTEYYDMPSGGGVFPAGSFIGTLEEPVNGYIREHPDWTPPQVRLCVQLGENVPIEDSPDPGAQKYWPEVTIEANGFGLHDVAKAEGGDAKALNAAIQRLVQLAVAVGFTNKGDPSFDIDTFIDELTSGTFEGQKVLFETWHQPRAKRSDENDAEYEQRKRDQGPFVNCRGFMPAF